VKWGDSVPEDIAIEICACLGTTFWIGDPEQAIVFDRLNHYWQEMVELAHIFDKNLYEVNIALRTFSKVDAFWQGSSLIEIASRRIDDHCSLTSFEPGAFWEANSSPYSSLQCSQPVTVQMVFLLSSPSAQKNSLCRQRSLIPCPVSV